MLVFLLFSVSLSALFSGIQLYHKSSSSEILSAHLWFFLNVVIRKPEDSLSFLGNDYENP